MVPAGACHHLRVCWYHEPGSVAAAGTSPAILLENGINGHGSGVVVPGFMAVNLGVVHHGPSVHSENIED